MSFLNPLFLLGLLAVSIPLLIHLLRLRRPPRIEFSTLAFFDALRQESLRRISIKKWLLLALRMLALAMLALVLARPVLTGGGGADPWPDEIVILFDNSPSMGQVDRGGPLLEQAKNAARERIIRAGSERRFYLEVTNGPPLRLPALGATEVLEWLARVEVVNQGNFVRQRLEEMAARRRESGRTDGREAVWFFTDGQATQLESLAEEGSGAGALSDLTVIRVGERPQSNVAVVSIEAGPVATSPQAEIPVPAPSQEGDTPSTTRVPATTPLPATAQSLPPWVLDPDEPLTVTARVKNFSEHAITDHFLSLYLEEGLAGQLPVQLEAGEEGAYSFEIRGSNAGETGCTTGTFLLEGDEWTFDNRRYFSMKWPQSPRIIRVAPEEESRPFASRLPVVLQAAGAGERREAGAGGIQLSPSGWESLFEGEEPDAILLDGANRLPEDASEELARYVREGGGLLLLPGAEADPESWNRLLARLGLGRITGTAGSYGSMERVAGMAPFREGHPLLEGLFEESGGEPSVNLPDLYFFLTIDLPDTAGIRPVLRTGEGSPLLLESRVGEGRVVLFLAGADRGWSDFPVKPLFAPLFHRVVRYLGAGEEGGLLEQILGEPFRLRISHSPSEVLLRVEGRRVIPEQRRSSGHTFLGTSGVDWVPGFVELELDGVRKEIAVNQNAAESDFRMMRDDELTMLLHPFFASATVEKWEAEGSGRAGEQEASPVASFFRNGEGGQKEIWHWFVLAALGLLLAESFLSRAWRFEPDRKG